MDKNKQTVRIGVFDLVDMADKAVQGLVDAGYEPDRIAVMCSDRATRRHFPDLDTPRPAGATTARLAGIGALLGGLGTLAIATTGGLALAGAGAVMVLVGAGTGSFVGAMTSRGVEPEIANYYDQALENGKILVAITTDGDADEAERVFTELGAHPVPLSEG